MADSGVSSQWLALLFVCFCLHHCISAGNVKDLQQPDRPTSLAIAEDRHHNGLPKTLRESRYAKLPHIVDYACAAAETSSQGNFDPEKCNATKMYAALLYCPVWSTFGWVVDSTWTAVGQNPSGVYSPRNQRISALLILSTLLAIFGKQHYDTEVPELQQFCWRTGSDGLPISFGIARDLVQGCRLAHPLPGCPFLQNGVINYSDEYVVPLMTKSILLGTLVMEDFLAPSTNLHKDLCWEPELRDAYSLYQRPGPWQVDDRCVNTLQDFATKMIMLVARTCLSCPNMKQMKGAPDWWPVAVELLTDVFSGSSDVFLQRFIFPSFQRFKDTARQRRGSVTTGHKVQSSVVSCHGLQGTREQVEGNLVQLLRLVLVNDIHLFQHDPRAYAFTSVANHLLHCTLLLLI